MSPDLTRRDFLKWLGVGAGAATVGGGLWWGTHQAERPSPGRSAPVSAGERSGGDTGGAGDSGLTAPMTAADLDRRKLVVIELDGGNDGLSTLVPYGISRYYDLRTTTAIDAGDVHRLDHEVGWHPNLERLAQRKPAVVQGVGSHKPDGSHFEMMRRWWAGDPDGTRNYDTGFLGRLADAIGDPSAAAVGLSIGTGASPAMVSKRVSTLALSDADSARYLVGADPGDAMQTAYQRAFAAFSQTDADGALGWLRGVDRQAASFAASLFDLQSGDERGYPAGNFGDSLRLAADLIDADIGVRILHVPLDGSFDTHEGQNYTHADLLGRLDENLDAFLADIDQRGKSNEVLVMTTSEFGRRAADEGRDGLDHGTASVGMLFGPVTAGRFGDYPSLNDLDHDANLVATVGFDSYYGTIAERWLGVPAGELFDTTPELLHGMF